MTANVLVVDDAATVRLFHATILREAGYQVAEAVNGYDGLEAALHRAYQLLVVDVNMPRLDGYSLIETIRQRGPNQATPVVMVSAEDRECDADRAYRAGANIYLTKPVSAEQLTLMAEMLTGGSR